MPPLDRTIELTKLIQSRISECDAIKRKAEEENRHLTGEEMSKMTAFITDVEVYTAELELEKREMAARDGVNKSSASRVIKPDGSVLDDRQAKYPGLPPKGQRFENFGEQLFAIRRAGVDLVIDTRLRAAATGLGESIPSDGGFLVQQDFSTELLKAAYDKSPVLSRVRRIQVGANANGLKINALKETTRSGSIWGGIILYWLGEGGEKQASKPAFRQLVLELKKVAGLWYATDELLQDATALGQVANEGFAEALDVEMEDMVMSGTGVGQPLGIMNSGALITVPKEDGQLADTIDGMNIVKMFARMWARGIGTAVWLISQSIFPQLMNMSLPGFPNIPMWMPPQGLAASPYGTLMGRPLFAIENCAKLGDKGDLVFADLSQYLLIDKGGPQQASSIHVRFIYDETAFRIVYRTDGQPIWNAALTPRDGGDTVSPFVTLEARA